jgi:transglutaminase-like putative cysteine protease
MNPGAARLAQQLARGLARDKSDTLLLLGACALVMMPHAWHLPLWATLSGALLLFWRGWITFHGRRMPPRWLLLPLVGMLMGGVYASYHGFLGREPGVAMLVLLLALKLLEMRAQRDLFVVVFLAFFVLLTNFFYSQTIAGALLAAVGIIAILTAQLSFQYTGAHPPLRRRVGLALRMFLLAAPLTLVLFLFFPRIQGPLWGMPADAGGTHTGLSDSMEPGNISELKLSADIVFRVRFIDAAPARSEMYWRGPVLGRFDGRSWTPLRSRASQGARKLDGLARRVRYQVTLEPSGRRSLFALDLPLMPPQLPGNPVQLRPDAQLLARAPLNERLRYEASSWLDYRLQPDAGPEALRDWLQLPANGNPRTREYAARLRASTQRDEERMRAVLRMFRNEGFRYTLRPPRLGADTVDEFLFDTRAGFCEHYASAFVVLMRLMDIPARVVTGYQGGELNSVDGNVTVRQSDAHAWAEVWLANAGWVRIDPTAAVAPERIERDAGDFAEQGAFAELLHGAAGPWLAALRRLRDNRDALNHAWNQWVLNYTPERQRGLLQSLGIEDPDWSVFAALLLGLGAAAVALVALPLLRQRQKADPLEALYKTLCERLAREGWPRAPHEGPRSYRLRLAAANLPAPRRDAILRFLELYESGRYSADMNRGALPLSSLLNQLRYLLKQSR